MSPVNADREVAQIYARQADRAGRAAVTVIAGGAVATVAFAFGLVHATIGVRIGVIALGAALTAAMYTLVSHLQARAEAAAVRHLADTIDATLDE